MPNPFDPNNAANQAEAMRRQQETLRRQRENARQQQERQQQQQESLRRLQEFGRPAQGSRGRSAVDASKPMKGGGGVSRVIGILMFFLIVAI